MGDFSLVTKTRGYYFETNFESKLNVHFKRTNTVYSWSRVPFFIYGVLLAKTWISNEGETLIVNHRTKETCLTKYYPPPMSIFSKEPINKIECLIRDANKRVHFLVEGCCSTHLDYARVLEPTQLNMHNIFNNLKSKLKLGPRTFLWKNIDIRYNKSVTHIVICIQNFIKSYFSG